MTFTDQQVRRLKAKLEERRVKTREHRGRDLSYVEGWYVMAEANRIFGYDGWDRLSHNQQLLYERRDGDLSEVAYLAKVRVIVRAGGREVVREGTGVGAAINTNIAEAHELAVKSAETDATKRALATFGNRFGLSLYDKAQAGVTKPVVPGSGSIGMSNPGPLRKASAEDAMHAVEPDDAVRSMHSALIFLKGLRERLRRAADMAELDEILTRTQAERERLRDSHQDLRDRHGAHLVDVAMSIAGLRRQELERGISRAAQGARVPQLRLQIDKSALTFPTTKRLRNKEHLKRVATLPCLVCGRKPSHAHHLRHAQSRGLGLKVSDEFTVPLCAIDHDHLHRSADERTWWRDKGIDPLPTAEHLWRASLRPQPDADHPSPGVPSID